MSTSTPDSPLSDLCSICHLQPPKYRCPRCSTRTCSLPCTRRHKLWSQCSGIRDPAAYLRRSELATESAFDRDFNFITGIERSIERAGRDAENRGIDVASSNVRDLEAVGLDAGDVGGDGKKGGAGAGAGAGGKRKRGGDTAGGGGTRAEMEFLRRAEERGVRVVRAPKGMSRNKGNGSRWLGRNQCLVWTVEWILSDGEKRMRNCSEMAPVADSFDRVVPLSQEEGGDEQDQKQTGDEKPGETPESKTEQQPQDATTTAPEPALTTQSTQPTDTPTAQPEASEATPTSDVLPLTPHRGLYFYLHRPRTATKQPVLVPLSPKTTIAAALRGHTVLEFPTIYVLPDSPDTIRAQEGSEYILEDEYLRTHQSPEESSEDTGDADDTLPPGAIDLQGVDESKVLEVLQKDLFEPSAAA
ncbi:uncharacterized protein AKAW2_41179S [Aspergillus luchuensis]|uniref:Box C/D snoRNA protein 1 n=1 Tax=Aspergillus kawachii TaxID=1069201 RepID=A0A146F080_ASPKA|nr:uncharacterized protein AKAW2_41179S [Aspergillus luchuensis]BCR99496.1 hypothetical protein AKAW2_41179S [Aspergillus luchuensis]BCS11797.1 hypothetical protein ALUC_41137S [Aspergillus luchuensis]GAT19253.1 hypothetical protein RIB2604_00401860 [Aspergillus luchuensis]